MADGVSLYLGCFESDIVQLNEADLCVLAGGTGGGTAEAFSEHTIA